MHEAFKRMYIADSTLVAVVARICCSDVPCSIPRLTRSYQSTLANCCQVAGSVPETATIGSRKCFDSVHVTLTTLPRASRSAHFAAGSSNGGTGPGVTNADFILYVTAEHVDCTPYTTFSTSGGTQAYASTCSLDTTTGRPLAGMTNW